MGYSGIIAIPQQTTWVQNVNKPHDREEKENTENVRSEKCFPRKFMSRRKLFLAKEIQSIISVPKGGLCLLGEFLEVLGRGFRHNLWHFNIC